MLSNPTPTPPGGSRTIASKALRKAGLMDGDTRMRDATGDGRKGKPTKIHRTSRPRAVNAILGKDQPSSSNKDPRVVARIVAQAASEGLSIRGASRAASMAAAGRIPRRSDQIRAANVRRHPQSVELWRQFILKRWNKEARFVNLERVADDEFIKQNGMTPVGSKSVSGREFAVIFKLISQLEPKPQTLSLAHNSIPSGMGMSTLSHYLPDLQNLSLEGNELKTFKDIDYIGRKGKLTKLRELVLLGNPVREFEYKNGRAESFKSDIARRFPSLEILDQEPVQKITFDVPLAESSSSASMAQSEAPTTFPNDMGPSFVTGVPGTVVSDFLVRFFPLFDSQRSALVDVYDSSATFSFSANTSIPARARVQGYHHSKEMPNQTKLEWQPWLNGALHGSRNLCRISQNNMDKVTHTLHTGNEQIIRAISDLPSTRHDLVGAPDKFCVDAWPIPQGDTTTLFVTLHGQFAELPSEGVRSFDRTLVLAPAPDGSRAKQAGWNVVVLSDQWTVRAYSSHESWKPGPMKVQADNKANAASGAKTLSSWLSALDPQLQARLQDGVASIPEPHRTQVLEVCRRTALNVQYSIDCLQGNSWDLERAVANFQQVKANLPREAYL